MKLKIKNEIVLPILFLMVVPIIIVSILFFGSIQRIICENMIHNTENSFNLITERIHQIDDEFYMKQVLSNELSSLENINIVAYEGDNIVYSNLDGIQLDSNRTNLINTKLLRYIIINKTYDKLNITVYAIIDKRDIFFYVIDTYKPYIALIVISILISLKVILLIFESFSKPISILLEGYNDIIAGNYKNSIDIKREDELGLLGQAFNEMKKQISLSSNKFLQMKRLNEDILRNISTGIITTDMYGDIRNCNDAAEEIIERVIHINEKKSNIIKTLMLQINETIYKMDSINNVVSFKQYETKEPLYFDINTSLMKNCTGDCIGVICSFNDITNRKKIEESVERIDRLASLGQLTAGLAHEIRNPLSGIKMGAQILSKRLDNYLRESDSKIFEEMIKETDRLNLLITDLLNFSKPRIPKLQIVDVYEVIDKAIRFLDEKIRAKETSVHVNYDMKGTKVYFDNGQLIQIFLNIITNALDAIEMKHGELIINVQNAAETDNKYVLVSFEDNGCGIKKENTNIIFNPFFTTRESGTGLGLSVVHKLVTSNDGYIEIESMESVGTTVKIYLPIYRSEKYGYKSFNN